MSVGAKRKYKNCEKSGHGLSSVGGLVLLCVGEDWEMLPFVVEWTVSSAQRRMKKSVSILHLTAVSSNKTFDSVC